MENVCKDNEEVLDEDQVGLKGKAGNGQENSRRCICRGNSVMRFQKL